MNKVININFHGRIIPIEEQAYDQLKKYIEQLNHFFALEEGKDEIINDIESRIAELLAGILKQGEPCITSTHISSVLASMGQPEEFETEEATVKSRLQQEAGSGSAGTSATNPFFQKTFARSSTNRYIAGVCGGFGDYLNVDAIWFRVAAIVFFFPLVIAYLVLWAVLPERADLQIGTTRKKLFRDVENRNIAGVAAGLATYFDINVWIPRVLFLLPLLSSITHWDDNFYWGWGNDFWRVIFGNGPVLAYIVMWILLPEARTASEKLQMKGEKVDFNSIRNTVTGDLLRFQSRLKMNDTLHHSSKGLARAIETIVKIILYIIIFSLVVSLIIGLGAAGVAGLGLMRYTPFLFNDFQGLLIWAVVILFFWVPVIGLIVWLIRRITGSKANSGPLRYSFSALWTLGWVALILLIAQTSSEFSRNASLNSEQILRTPQKGILRVTNNSNSYWWEEDQEFDLDPFRTLNSDTLYAPNMNIEIVSSQDSLFHSYLQRISNGSTRSRASLNADFDFPVRQEDSLLILPKGIPISRERKFRNQGVILQIAVPVGGQILVEENVPRWHNVNISFGPDGQWNRRRRYGRMEIGQDWKEGVLYLMTESGLRRADGKTSEEEEKEEKDWDDMEDYRRSRQELEEKLKREKQELEQRQRELEQMEKELGKPMPDSSGYRYKSKTTRISVLPVSLPPDTPGSAMLGNLVFAKHLL